MKHIVHMGDRWLLFSGADPGMFVGRGVQPSKKMDKQKKNTHTHTHTHTNTNKSGEGGRFSIYSVLVRSKSNLVIETAFRTIVFHKYDLPLCFLSTKTHFVMIVLVL